MSTPFSALAHGFEVVVEGSILILVEERPEKMLILGHEGACLFPHDHVGSLGSVELICKGSEQTIAVSNHIDQSNLERHDFLIKCRVVITVVFGELESVSFGHLLPEFDLHLLV